MAKIISPAFTTDQKRWLAINGPISWSVDGHACVVGTDAKVVMEDRQTTVQVMIAVPASLDLQAAVKAQMPAVVVEWILAAASS